MGNQKLICAPTMFQPWLNQTEIDLSKKKVELINRETYLLKLQREIGYELLQVKQQLSGLDDANNFAQACHNLNLRRR